MNIFEGSRRILKVVCGATVIGFGIAALYINPSSTIYFRVDSPTSIPVRISAGCPSGSASEFFSTWTDKNSRAWVTLCFPPSTFKDSKTGKDVLLVPYEYDPKTQTTWGGAQYSSEVSSYTSKVRNAFILPPEDQKWIDTQFWHNVLREIGTGFIGMCLMLASILGLSWVIGWVVRGFMGIPKGKDSKPTEVS